MTIRLTRSFIVPMAMFWICLGWAGMSRAATVTVDIAAKTSKSDVGTLDPSKPKISGEQVGIFIKSTIIEPQYLTLKFVGLADQDYDVYVNHSYKGVKPAREFESGVGYRIDGRIVDSAMTKCLAAVKEPVNKTNGRLQALRSSEAKRICWTLGQATDWVQTGLARDQAWRSVSVIVVPSGKMLEPMEWLVREGEYETARAVTNACWLLQQARDRMYDVIRDPVLRNEVVAALTPVGFAAAYSTKNGKPHIDAKVTNNCDLPVSGTISYALPSGWKTNAKKLKFEGLKSGQTFSTSFDLLPPSKAGAPESVPVAANVTVTRGDMTASFKLKIIACMPAPASVK